MARRITRKSIKHDEFVDGVFDIGTWIEKHWKTVAGIVGGILAVVVLVLLWRVWVGHRMDVARSAFEEGLKLYTAEAQENPGEAVEKFRYAAARSGSSALGQIATYYEGAALLRNGDAAEAARVLQTVVDGAGTRSLTDTARAMLAKAQGEAGDVDGAVASWRELADSPDALYPGDLALFNLEKLLTREGREEEATRVRRELLDRYPGSPYAAQL